VVGGHQRDKHDHRGLHCQHALRRVQESHLSQPAANNIRKRLLRNLILWRDQIGDAVLSGAILV
jgi:hypothetical protein